MTNVSRIDFTANLLMKHQPGDYYPFLIECPKYDRHQDRNSLYFTNRIRSMIFYDKLAEATTKGVTIPEVVQACNLLRYEWRLLNRINRQLNRNVIDNLLADEQFYIKIVKRWHAEY